jgi:predicted component of type VI protein secretion system
MANEQLQTLLLLLPFAGRITSDDVLTAWAFSAVLGDPVTITRTPPTSQLVEPDGLTTVGGMELGIDAVLGNMLDDGLPSYRIDIGPLAASAIPAYLEGGQREPLLSLLEGYFLPVEADTSRCLFAIPEDQCFALATEDTQCLLGFTTYI